MTIPVSNSAASQYAQLPVGTGSEARIAPAPLQAQRLDPANPRTLNRDENSAPVNGEFGNSKVGSGNDITTPVPTAPEATSALSNVSLPGNILIGGWGALAALALAALVISYVRAVKSLGNRSRVPAEHHANQTLRSLCEQVDIRHVPFLTRSSEINSPVCLPRREICLPDWAFEDMDRKALDSLIAHELAHMLRRDPMMMIFTQTLSRIFFFQPMFVVARRRLEDNA